MIKKMILAYHADCAVMADCKRCFRDFVASAHIKSKLFQSVRFLMDDVV